MNIFKKFKLKAFWRNIDNKGFNSTDHKTLWQSKIVKWNWVRLSYGIRNSDKPQYFPIWNMSNNNNRALLFGLGFWFLDITYHRVYSFNQRRYLPLRKFRIIYKLYQLFI